MPAATATRPRTPATTPPTAPKSPTTTTPRKPRTPATTPVPAPRTAATPVSLGDRVKALEKNTIEQEKALHGVVDAVESIQKRMRRPSLKALAIILVIGAIVGIAAGFAFASWDKLANDGIAAVLGVCFAIMGCSISYLVRTS